MSCDAATRTLRSHWRGASDAEFRATLRLARRSVAGFAAATARFGSLLQSWIRGTQVVEFEHYPKDDVVDLRTGSQFYYHAHRHAGHDHGHLHLFWHATASGRRRHARGARLRWLRSEPTHLLAISLDDRGLPVALFTVNRWVTQGHWFDAAATLRMVDRFRPRVPDHEHSGEWLTGFLRMYRPVIGELLARRDSRLGPASDWPRSLANHRLEVLSAVHLDWVGDLAALEEEASQRRRQGSASRAARQV